jgi:hypothetical protein
MTTPTVGREDPERVMKEALDLLQAFLEADSGFAISNHSLTIMVGEFRARLEQAAGRGEALALLREWRRGMPAVRAELLKGAQRIGFADGGAIPLLSEGDASRVTALCPDRPTFR